MKAKIIIGIICLLMIGTIIADDLGILRDWKKDKFIPKEIKDELLENTNQKDIKINVTLKCEKDSCIWTAKQEGIMNTEEKINRVIEDTCLKKFTTKEGFVGCKEYGTKILTEEEIEEIIAEEINNRLTKAGNSKLNKVEYKDISKGELTIGEPK